MQSESVLKARVNELENENDSLPANALQTIKRLQAAISLLEGQMETVQDQAEAHHQAQEAQWQMRLQQTQALLKAEQQRSVHQDTMRLQEIERYRVELDALLTEVSRLQILWNQRPI
eukprot:Platyproteum_vivax@DN2811_c0_g1_i2.p2